MGNASGGSSLNTGMSMGRDRTHNTATSTYLGDDAGRRPGMLDQLMNDYRTGYRNDNNNANRLLGGGNNSQIGDASGYEKAGFDWNPDTNSNFASYGGTGADQSITDPGRQGRIDYGAGGPPGPTGANSGGNTGGGGAGGAGGDGGGGGPIDNGDTGGPGGTDWGKEGGGSQLQAAAGAPVGNNDPGNGTSDTGQAGSSPGLMDYYQNEMFTPETGADQEVTQGWRDFAQQSPDEAATNDAWKKYAGGATSQETGLINSAQNLADASDPRLAAANIAATQGDQYLGSKYKDMADNGGLNAQDATALRTSANLANRAATDTAAQDIGRTIARRGNAAGAYAAQSNLGAQAAQSAGERERQNILDLASLKRQDRTAGLAGLNDVSGREQARNVSQAGLQDAGSNRILSATTQGLGALGTALNNQRGYQATGIQGTAASNAALAAKQGQALTAGQQSAKDMAARKAGAAAGSQGLYNTMTQSQIAQMNAAANLGTKPTELYTDATDTSGNGGFSV